MVGVLRREVVGEVGNDRFHDFVWDAAVGSWATRGSGCALPGRRSNRDIGGGLTLRDLSFLCEGRRVQCCECA